MGYADLHSHLLWAIDDGCQSPEETLAAARLLVDLGWTDVASTPHAHPLFPSNDPSACAARRREAQALLDAQRIPLRIHAGAENPLDGDYLARCDGEGRRGLGETGRWSLVELPFQGSFPAMPDLLFRLARKGIRPLIAHPERCAEFDRPGRAAEAVRLGAALQLNLGAVVDLYGRSARKQAERLLDDGLYGVAATDLHHADGAEDWLPEALVVLGRRVGTATLEQLCGANPARILAGEPLA